MELKDNINAIGKSLLYQIKIINKVELYGRKEYDFLYGKNNKIKTFRNFIKQIKRAWNK
ncbi:MAG: hypothetical protein Unbinned3987contig1001_46 [Prokaryotic dsDNA virus sp.]|jgi:hypothetical protein|nr:MAG: hypothetical protein Unbinned3987contig1001_46 [Prokaryotic dsDNA virus sp.]|tara:strand:- start:274 stop:450 length:177 start_codon:yes stop_codon:yes gene_type:complete